MAAPGCHIKVLFLVVALLVFPLPPPHTHLPPNLSWHVSVQRWLTFQLLHALSQAHARGVCHGDIKSENVMVTSWNWLLLTDFASYKPTYLPADNPVRGRQGERERGRRECCPLEGGN